MTNAERRRQRVDHDIQEENNKLHSRLQASEKLGMGNIYGVLLEHIASTDTFHVHM